MGWKKRKLFKNRKNSGFNELGVDFQSNSSSSEHNSTKSTTSLKPDGTDVKKDSLASSEKSYMQHYSSSSKHISTRSNTGEKFDDTDKNKGNSKDSKILFSLLDDKNTKMDKFGFSSSEEDKNSFFPFDEAVENNLVSSKPNNVGLEESNESKKDMIDIQMQIQVADQCYLKNDFDVAKDLYVDTIKSLDENNEQYKEIAGDIQVKISNILQVNGDVSGSIAYLRKAEESFRKCIEKSGGTNRHVVSQKLVEIITGTANALLNLGEIDSASDSFKDAIEVCKDSCLPMEQLSTALLNYANFLSICKKDHDEAIDIMKETLKLQIKTSDGQMNPLSASVLSSLGKVFMRRSNVYNSNKGIQDAKRAEGCFLRALELYRISTVGNADEKVVDTLCNLNESRERQVTNKSILRKKVRFKELMTGNSNDYLWDTTALAPNQNGKQKITKTPSNDDTSLNSAHNSSYFDDSRSEWSKDSRSLYSSSMWDDDSVNFGACLGLGYQYICNCVAINGPPDQVAVP